MTRHLILAGAGPGIGAAVARRFAREGFAVSLIARAPAAVSEGIGDPVPADLADPAAAEAAVAAAIARRGMPEVVVYNAARWVPATVADLTPAAFAAELSLSVVGALAVTRAALPAMRAAGRGSLLYTGGGLALRPEYGGEVPGLTAGKSALRGLVHAMAGEFAGYGLHAAMVTVAGLVAAGGPFDPDRIAEAYWDLHAEAPGGWSVERVFTGA